jgi:F-box/WD-40 domain protein 7
MPAEAKACEEDEKAAGATSSATEEAEAKPSRGEPVVVNYYGHRGPVKCLHAFGLTFFSAGEDNTIIMWDIQTGHKHCSHVAHKHWIECMYFDEATRVLVTGSLDNTALAYDTVAEQPICRFEGHTNGINCIVKAGDLVYTGSLDCQAKIWRMGQNRPIYSLVGHKGPIECLLLVEERNLLYTGSWDGTIIAWNATDGALVHTFGTGKLGPGGVACSRVRSIAVACAPRDAACTHTATTTNL